MNTLHPTETLTNWDLVTLSPQTELFFSTLEKNTGVAKEKFISGILNGTENLEDLEIANAIIEREKSSDFKTFSNEEAKIRLGL